MRRWPLVVFGVFLAIVIAACIASGTTQTAGGGWSVLWISVFGVGALIMARVPDNSVGTILFAYGVLAMPSGLLLALAEETSPDSVPWYEPLGWAINSAAISCLGFMLLRFPDGKLLSRRWHAVDVLLVVAATASATGAIINNGWGGDPDQARLEGPLRDEYGDIGDIAAGIGNAGTLAILLGLVSIVVRYRQVTGPQRTQMRSLLFATIVAAILMLFFEGQFSNDFDSTSIDVWIAASIIALIPLSIGVAIVKHGLYDIDFVISKSLIYGSVLAVIAGVYVAIVFGIGNLIGDTTSNSPVLQIIATAVIAIIFQPARERLERVANRIVFGRRATPYEVLSDFTHRVAATDDTLLADIASSIVDGTVATAAVVTSADDVVSAWPADVESSAASEIHPIEHDGEAIGELRLTVPAGETLSRADEALINELTKGLGLALWNRSLTADLQASVDDLQASRRRMVAIQDETRHTLERDLHDGAQQRLVAIKVRLSIARQMAEKNGDAATAATLAHLCDRADEAVETLRDFARGVYPPLLEAEGLGAALRAHIDRNPLPITLEDSTTRRHDRDVEATTYFAILETLAAIERGPVEITVIDSSNRVEFVVTSPDAFEPPTHLVDRFAALDGSIEFALTEGRGQLPTSAARVLEPELVTA